MNYFPSDWLVFIRSKEVIFSVELSFLGNPVSWFTLPGMQSTLETILSFGWLNMLKGDSLCSRSTYLIFNTPVKGKSSVKSLCKYHSRQREYIIQQDKLFILRQVVVTIKKKKSLFFNSLSVNLFLFDFTLWNNKCFRKVNNTLLETETRGEKTSFQNGGFGTSGLVKQLQSCQIFANKFIKMKKNCQIYLKLFDQILKCRVARQKIGRLRSLQSCQK